MNPIEANTNMYNTQMGYTGIPLSGTTTTTETLQQPPYNSLINDSFPLKAAMKSESGLTYNIPRKRSRESMINSTFLSHTSPPQPQKNCSSFSFLGEDISFQIQQQQFDIDRLISQHVRILFNIQIFNSKSLSFLLGVITKSFHSWVCYRWRR